MRPTPQMVGTALQYCQLPTLTLNANMAAFNFQGPRRIISQQIQRSLTERSSQSKSVYEV